MQKLLLAILLPAAVCLYAAEAAGHELEIVATAATASVEPGGDGRRTIRLAGLTYGFQLQHACDAPYEPESLLLTVADTRYVVPVSDLGAGNARLTVAIPPEQIPPIPIVAFCLVDAAEDAHAVRALTLPSALSASASLRCGSGEQRAVRYASAPLDIVLVCAAEVSETAAE